MAKKDSSLCQVPKCRRRAEITYLGREVCDVHWQWIDKQPQRLKRALGLEKEAKHGQG